MEERPSHAELLTGIEIRAEVLRSRNERKPVQPVSAFRTRTAWTAWMGWLTMPSTSAA